MERVEIAECGCVPLQTPRGNVLRHYVGKLPQPIRFLGVGGLGLITDLSVFTLMFGGGTHPLGARLVSLAIATLVTWRLNRALTFDPSGRHQGEEALRYGLVTATAQGTNYAVFASLVVTVFASLPQAALLAGAVAAAGLSYTGHRLFSFAARTFPHGAVKHEEAALR
jgi:putative flippase GtrA